MDLNWKLNKTEHIVQDEWIDFRKNLLFFQMERNSPLSITIQEETLL